MPAPYSQNTSGTTLDGILAAIIDLGAGTNNTPYIKNTSGVTLNAVLAALQDKLAGTSTGPYARNTSGTLLDLAADAAAAIAAGTTVPTFNPASYGTTWAGVVAALVDLANGTDSRPYPKNTSGVTLNGILDALTDIVAAGGIGGPIALSSSSIAEAAANSDSVGSASISPVYTGTPSWSISDPTNTFQINSSTGAVTVLSNADLGSFPYFDVVISVSGTTPTFPPFTARIWVVPTAPVIAMLAASDTGASNSDNITSNTDPSFSVIASMFAGDSFQWYVGGVAYGAAHTVTSGDVSSGTISTGATPFSDGAKAITATLGRGGFTSSASNTVNATIDTVAPVISSPSGTKTGSSTANLSVATNTTSGTLYWVVSTSATPPSAAQIKAGQDSTGSTAAAHNSTAVAASPVTPSASGLSGATVYYSYFMQEDVAGNQSNVASAASFTTDAGGYAPQGILSGATFWAAKTSALTSVSNGKSALISLWLKNPNATGAQRTILGGDTAAANRFALAISGSTGHLFFNGYDSSATIRVSIQTATNYASMAAWGHFLLSFNSVTPRGQIYVNDVSDIAASPTLDSSANVVFAAGDNTLLAGITGGTPLLGNVADLQIWFNKDIDLTTTANRRLFIDGSGNAVNPATAAATLGTPDILCAGDFSAWYTNQGGGGGFTVQAGSISNAATSPP